MSDIDPSDQAMIDAYKAGATLRTVAERFDTNAENVRRTLQRHAVKRRPAAPPTTPAARGWFNPKALTKHRKLQGMSRADLAEKTGISVRTLERHENVADEGQPPLATLHLLAKALGIEASQLMRGVRDLRWTRIAAGLSTDAFADLIGVSRQQLSKIERGKATFPEHMIPKAANALDVSDAVLSRRVGLDDYRPPAQP